MEEMTTIRQTEVQTHPAPGARRRRRQEGEAAADPFMQIIANMVAMMGQDPQQAQTPGSSVEGAAEAAEALLAIPAAQAAGEGEALPMEQAAALLAAEALPAPAEEPLRKTGTAELPPAENPLANSEKTAQPQGQQPAPAEWTAETMGESRAPDAPETGTEQQVYRAESRFHQAVEDVKTSMKQQEKPVEKRQQPLDVDQLQSEAAVRRPVLQQPMAVKSQAAAKPAPVAQQVLDGLQEKAALGKTEFTMKLKPANLGEITVKLTETDGKMTLHLTTANTQTTRLLNNELEALREAVRPMQVEVHEAVTQPGQTPSEMMQQFSMDFAGRQFSGRQQSFTRRPSYGGEAIQAAAAGQEAQAAQQVRSGLDLYI